MEEIRLTESEMSGGQPAKGLDVRGLVARLKKECGRTNSIIVLTTPTRLLIDQLSTISRSNSAFRRPRCGKIPHLIAA